MLLKITERNSWEQASWSHIIDVSKQDAQAVNDLLRFIRLANSKYDEIKKEMAGSRYFAASYYQAEFYDSHDEDEHRIMLRKRKTRSIMVVHKSAAYKDNELSLDHKISTRKIKSAVLAMKRGDNVLYKNFESVFLKSKQK
jgi:hypothetical protein